MNLGTQKKNNIMLRFVGAETFLFFKTNSDTLYICMQRTTFTDIMSLTLALVSRLFCAYAWNYGALHEGDKKMFLSHRTLYTHKN